MAQKRHYEVRSAFPVRSKKGELVWIRQATAGLIDDLLSEKQIAEHVKAGDLVDNGAVTPETAKSEK